jgi:hypothetical protein
MLVNLLRVINYNMLVRFIILHLHSNSFFLMFRALLSALLVVTNITLAFLMTLASSPGSI